MTKNVISQINISKTKLEQILPLRALFLQQTNFQVRYNACHERRWSDSYVIHANDQAIGYGAVKGKDRLKDRDAIFEFYLLPAFQNKAASIFSELIQYTNVPYLECQTNDLLLSSMVFEFGKNIHSEVVLFEDHTTTQLSNDTVLFRRLKIGEAIPWLKKEDFGTHILELEGQIIATGGILTHYNPPFADLYMEVQDIHQKKGFGSLLVQELKKACYNSGRVPAARCNITNPASKATLLKAGFKIAGYMLQAKL